MMRVLLTGGAGFIGSHLAERLLRRGDEVVIVDSLTGTYPRTLKEHNLEIVRARAGRVEAHEIDVCDREALGRLFAAQRFDVVVHLAALAGVRPSLLEPARYAMVNVVGTANVVELALAHGVLRVLCASSSSVYGDSTPLPAREDAVAVAPSSPYAATKRAGELVALGIARHHPELTCTQLRFFTVYGPRQRPEMAISKFIRAALAGQPLTLYGDGSMRRDFTFVDDIVDGIELAMEKGRGYQVLNLGSGAPVDLLTLAQLIERALGITVTRVHEGRPPGDVDATYADLSLVRERLGWSPRTTLADGIARTVEWIRQAG